MGKDIPSRESTFEELGDLAGQPSSAEDITELLVAWGEGDAKAGEELMRRVEDRLQKLARRFLQQERANHTLETADLINEAYLRLIRQEKVTWQGRRHFFALTGRMMRRILVDHARRRMYFKHGGQMERLPEEVLERQLVASRDERLVALDEALDALTEESLDLAMVVELRYFVGLTGEEVAESLGISRPTVQRRWKTARAWLYRYLKTESGEGQGREAR